MYIRLSIFALAFALACAEPPSYNPAQFQRVDAAPYAYSGWRPSGPEFKLPEPHRIYGPPQQQQYQAPRAPAQEYLPVSKNYGPPQQTYGAPSQEYAPPPQEYGPPAQEYGPPLQEYGPPPSEEYGPPEEPSTTTIEPEATTTELPTTTEANLLEAEDLGSGDADLQSENLKNTDEGVYYIYHPSGLLQRVAYATKDDVEKMAFSAKLKYENVEPIKGPIFTYDPKTYVFKRL